MGSLKSSVFVAFFIKKKERARLAKTENTPSFGDFPKIEKLPITNVYFGWLRK